MSTINVFIIKTLLLLWVVCVVLCEHQKRDVHRIVIKHRIPRSHKKGHRHTHDDHKSGHHHSGRSKGRGHKKGKKQLSSYEKDSFEDDRSQSRENSFEDTFQKRHKGHKSNHHDSKKSHRSPSYFSNQNFEETKPVPYKDYRKFMFQNEWVPLSSEQAHRDSHETYRETQDKKKRKRDSRKNHLTSLKPPPIDLTTSYPFQFEASSVFPQLISYQDAFSNFNLNQKIIESNQSPLIGTIEHPLVQFSELKDNYNLLKNHRPSYEVTELTPSGTNTNTYISVPDDSILEDLVGEVTTKSSQPKKEEEKSTQRPIRNRGRNTYRAQKKS